MSVELGPDASGVGWVYEYALTSKTKNLAQLRTLQDYYYKYALLECGRGLGGGKYRRLYPDLPGDGEQ